MYSSSNKKDGRRYCMIDDVCEGRRYCMIDNECCSFTDSLQIDTSKLDAN